MCTYIYIYIHIHTYTHAHTHTYVYTYISCIEWNQYKIADDTYAFFYQYTQTHTRIYTYIYILTYQVLNGISTESLMRALLSAAHGISGDARIELGFVRVVEEDPQWA